MGVERYVGGDPARWPLKGRRCFTAAQRPRTRLGAASVRGLLDSGAFSAPLLAATWPDPRKAGVRAATYRGNVAWWRRRLATLRGSPHYRAPPGPRAAGPGAVTGTRMAVSGGSQNDARRAGGSAPRHREGRP